VIRDHSRCSGLLSYGPGTDWKEVAVVRSSDGHASYLEWASHEYIDARRRETRIDRMAHSDRTSVFE
jgi:hypothetical protein